MKKRLCVYFMALLLTALLPMQALASDTGSSSLQKNSEEAAGVLDQVKDQLADAFKDIDRETGEEIFDFLKEKVSDGSLDTEEGLQETIAEGEEKFGVKLDEAEAKRLVDTMEKLEKLGFSAEYVVDKAGSLYEEYGADFVDHVDEVVTGAVKDAAAKAVNSFWANLKSAVGGFFSNLFH